MIKLIGALLVFGSCIGLAQKRIAGYKKSNSVLNLLISELKEMADNISFLKKPLPEIIDSLKQHQDDVFFKKVAECILSDGKYSVEKAWENALEDKDINITGKAKEILLLLGKTLGKQTAEQEEENINVSIDALRDVLKSEEELCRKNVKMMRSFGVLSGLMIVILFI